MATYTSYAQHSAQTITVTTQAELKAALATLDQSGGGTILLDGNGGPFKIIGTDLGDANNPILIDAVDPATPPLVTEIYLQNASHITMTNLHIDSTSTNITYHDIRVMASDNIEIVNNHMTSDADGFLGDWNNPVTQGGSLCLIRNSQDINFSGNLVEDYKGGAGFLEVNGLIFSENEMTGIQHDGFQAGGLQNAVISDNYMHDFYGSTQQNNHSDFIMIWGTNAKSVTTNVQISGNVLDTNGGAAYQGIFIGNNELGKNTGPSGQHFQNVDIFDNVIHTSMYHGIFLGATVDGDVYDNTVLFDPNAYTMNDPNSGWVQAEPWIMFGGSNIGGTVTGNIAGKISIAGGVNPSIDNYIIDYHNTNAANYVENHFINFNADGGVSVMDLGILPSSHLYGTYGSTISSASDPNDPLQAVIRVSEFDGYRGAVDLSADLTMMNGQDLDLSGANVTWTLDDGTVLHGTNASHVFTTPGLHTVTLTVTGPTGHQDTISQVINVMDQSNFDIDFDGGVSDSSLAASAISVKDPNGNALVQGLSGQGFHLDGTTSFTINKTNDQIFDLDTFDLNFDFKLDQVGSAGRLMGIHTSWNIQVTSNGAIKINLPTDQGKYTLTTSAGVLSDTAWHDIQVTYDGPANSLQIIVDGTVVGSGTATGSTNPSSFHGLVVGPTWGASVKGVIDNLSMESQPTTALATHNFGDDPTGDGTAVITAPIIVSSSSDPTALDPTLSTSGGTSTSSGSTSTTTTTTTNTSPSDDDDTSSTTTTSSGTSGSTTTSSDTSGSTTTSSGTSGGTTDETADASGSVDDTADAGDTGADGSSDPAADAGSTTAPPETTTPETDTSGETTGETADASGSVDDTADAGDTGTDGSSDQAADVDAEDTSEAPIPSFEVWHDQRYMNSIKKWLRKEGKLDKAEIDEVLAPYMTRFDTQTHEQDLDLTYVEISEFVDEFYFL